MNTSLHVRLEYRGRILHEAEFPALQTDLEIGRSSACDWSTPPDEATVGSHHAWLRRKGKQLWIEDQNSKNGTWYQGRRITKKRLKPGDRINIGDCQLCVEPAETARTAQVGPELLVLTGPARGQRKTIQAPRFAIGSDPKADLVFLDDLVSRQHVVINVKEDGYCWIKDCSSKNGTKVNDMPLRPEQERVLKDGDRVAVAHLEFSFHDGSSQQIKGQALRRMGVLVLTLAVALAVNFLLGVIRPSAEKRLGYAKEFATQEKFNQAFAELDKASSARGFENVRAQVEVLRSRLVTWQNALNTWQTAQDLLGATNWPEAARNLGVLKLLGPDAWTWGPHGGELQAQMQLAKTCVDLYLSTMDLDVPLDVLGDRQIALRNMLNERHDNQPYLNALYAAAETQAGQLQKLLANYRDLDNALHGVDIWSPPPRVDIVRKNVASIYERSEGMLKERAGKMLQPLEGLEASFARMLEMMQLVKSLQFSACRKMDIQLPSPELCAVDTRLARLRINIENATANTKKQADSLASLVDDFVGRTGTGAAMPVSITAWEDETVLGRVLACDCLQGSYPRRSRTAASSDYDRMLGVEEFCFFLRTLSEKTSMPSGFGTRPFTPVLEDTRRAAESAQSLLMFLDQADHAWLRGDKVSGLETKARELLRRHAAIIQMLKDRATHSSGRRAIIAGGIAWRLVGDQSVAMDDNLPLDRWLTVRLQALNDEIGQLNQQCERGTSAERIALRARILEVGLPGQPVVNTMWIEATAK